MVAGMFTKCCNLRTGTKFETFSLETVAMPQSRNYNEEPVQKKFAVIFAIIFRPFFPILLPFASPKGGGYLPNRLNPPLCRETQGNHRSLLVAVNRFTRGFLLINGHKFPKVASLTLQTSI